MSIDGPNNAIEFESINSSVLSELRMIMNDLSSGSNSMTFDESDPDLTGALAGLVGDENNKLSNAFQICERVKQELISRAEQAGSRALEWSNSHFERIGGGNTLRSVWRRLKFLQMVRGEKRNLTLSSGDEDDVMVNEHKKLKISLNISGTCELINNIELENGNDESLAMSDVTSQDRDEGNDQLHNLRVEEEGNSDNEELVLEAFDFQEGAAREVRIHWLDGESLSSVDSIPALASTESDSSRDQGQSSDSGMLEEMAGNVTNLCRNREPVTVRTGVITETGPLIPVSLGFSDMEEDEGDWEEVLDDYSRPTGMERRSFKLNVVSGDTESIDEDLDNVIRANGLFDGTNARREAGENSLEVYSSENGNVDGHSGNYSERSVSSSVSGEGYQAETSDSASENELDQYSGSYINDSPRCLDRARTTLSTSTSDRCLGGARTTLSGTISGMPCQSTQNLGGARTTLSGTSRGMPCQSTQTLGGTRTTLSYSMGGHLEEEFTGTGGASNEGLVEGGMYLGSWQANDDVQDNDIQGLRGECEATEGGGTTVALLMSVESDITNASNLDVVNDVSDDGLEVEEISERAYADRIQSEKSELPDQPEV